MDSLNFKVTQVLEKGRSSEFVNLKCKHWESMQIMCALVCITISLKTFSQYPQHFSLTFFP